MSLTTLESMVTTLFTAPGAAAIEADKAYRDIWAKWLQRVSKLIEGLPPGDVARVLAEHLKLAPILKVNGRIEMGLTMRVASVTERSGSVGINLGVGPIGVSGSYGFLDRSSEESVMQVRAAYTLTNDEVSLASYLSNLGGITLASAQDVTNAVAFLKKGDS